MATYRVVFVDGQFEANFKADGFSHNEQWVHFFTRDPRVDVFAAPERNILSISRAD